MPSLVPTQIRRNRQTLKTSEEPAERTLSDLTEIIYGDFDPWFAFSATLRIHGDGLDFEQISRTLGVEPTNYHIKGERKGPRSPEWRDDAWHYQPAIDESRPLTDHLNALWEILQPHVAFLKSLKRHCTVDVFCGYRSNSQTAGFEVDHRCLDIFIQLEVPFGVSVITLE